MSVVVDDTGTAAAAPVAPTVATRAPVLAPVACLAVALAAAGLAIAAVVRAPHAAAIVSGVVAATFAVGGATVAVRRRGDWGGLWLGVIGIGIAGGGLGSAGSIPLAIGGAAVLLITATDGRFATRWQAVLGVVCGATAVGVAAMVSAPHRGVRGPLVVTGAALGVVVLGNQARANGGKTPFTIFGGSFFVATTVIRRHVKARERDRMQGSTLISATSIA